MNGSGNILLFSFCKTKLKAMLNIFEPHCAVVVVLNKVNIYKLRGEVSLLDQPKLESLKSIPKF